MSTVPRYSVNSSSGLKIFCDDVDGFFVGVHRLAQELAEPDETPFYQLCFTMRNCTDLTADQVASFNASCGDVVVEVLDSQGETMGEYNVWRTRILEVLTESPIPCRRIDARISKLPNAASRLVWDKWRESRPASVGSWAELPVGQREGWLEAARLRRFPPLLDRRRSKVVMEGSNIDDLSSFFCAIGEAFDGPGGYMGSNFFELSENLTDLGSKKPTLIWKDMKLSSERIPGGVESFQGWASYVDVIKDVLAKLEIAPA